MNTTKITPAPTALAGHPGLEDIFLLLCSGWPALRVSIVVTRKYNQHAHPSDVQAYADTIPQAYFLDLDDISNGTLGDTDTILDVVGEMTSMLALLRDRIVAMQIAEDVAGKLDPKLPALVKTYFNLLEKYTAALQEYGVVPAKAKLSQPQAPAAPVQPEGTTLKEILDGNRAVSAVPASTLHREGVEESRLLEPTYN